MLFLTVLYDPECGLCRRAHEWLAEQLKLVELNFVPCASEEARKAFLQGRDLNEKLLIQDSITHFDKAISLDPNFAWAELSRANVSPTGKEFFDHLKKAVSLADKASNGEKLLILSTEAGANGNPAKQNEHLDQ